MASYLVNAAESVHQDMCRALHGRSIEDFTSIVARYETLALDLRTLLLPEDIDDDS